MGGEREYKLVEGWFFLPAFLKSEKAVYTMEGKAVAREGRSFSTQCNYSYRGRSRGRGEEVRREGLDRESRSKLRIVLFYQPI
jgi:hypothetical protein